MSAPAVVVPPAIPRPAASRRPARPRPRPRRDATAHAPVTAQVPSVTVTISVGAGDPARRDRVIAALCEVMAAAGPGLTTVVEAATAEPVRAAPAAAVQLSTGPRTVTLHGRSVELSRREYDLLFFLAGHPRRVFSRTQLLEQVWGDLRPGPRTVDVHVSRLRHKLASPHGVIATVRAVGYRLADDAPVAVIGH